MATPPRSRPAASQISRLRALVIRNSEWKSHGSLTHRDVPWHVLATDAAYRMSARDSERRRSIRTLSSHSYTP